LATWSDEPASGSGADTPASDHLLVDPAPDVEGYEVVLDAEQLDAETDAAWLVTANSNPAPTRTWVRTRAGEDSVAVHAYLYESSAVALATSHDLLVEDVCRFGTVPQPVEDYRNGWLTFSVSDESIAYSGFTFGPVRVVAACFNADLEVAEAHVVAVLEAEYEALVAMAAEQ
jgi:hypothetical protein